MTDNWIKFISRYALVAVTGTCVVYFGSAMIRRNELQDRINRKTAIAMAKKQEVLRARRIKEQDALRKARDSAEQEKAKLEAAAYAKTRPQKRPTKNDPVIKKKKKRLSNWGIIKVAKAKAYSNKGKFLKDLPFGTLADLQSTVKSKKGYLALCNFPDLEGNLSSNVLVRVKDLDLHSGYLSKASDAEINLSLKRLKIKLAIDQRTKQVLAERQKTNNPHYQRYATASAASKKFWDRVQTLTKLRDTSSGQAHVENEDELRKMKGEDIRVGQRLEAAEQAFKKWNREHANDPIKDAKIAALEKKLDSVEEQLSKVKEEANL